MNEKCFCHIKDANGEIYVVKDKEARERIETLEKHGSDGKVDKITTSGGYRVYAINKQGEQTVVQYSTSGSANMLVQRDGDGNFNVNTPSDNKHPANKAYVDGLVDALSDDITALNTRVNGISSLDEGKVGTLISDLSTLKNNLTTLTEAHNTSVTNLEGKISGAQSTANSALTLATTASNTATTAKNTASAAQTAASAAQTAATAAQSAASAAQSAADGKLTMNTSTGSYRVYAINKQGEQTVVQYSTSSGANLLVQRDGDGMFKINNPTESKHVANKDYVDSAVAAGGPKWSNTYDPNKTVLGVQVQPYYKDSHERVWTIKFRHILFAETESISHNPVTREPNPPTVETALLSITNVSFNAAGQMVSGIVQLYKTDHTAVTGSGYPATFCDKDGNPYSNNVVKWLQ